MGTKLSTALIPVCMGSRTEIRGMIPGAFTPTRRRSLAVIGPCVCECACFSLQLRYAFLLTDFHNAKLLLYYTKPYMYMYI